MHSTRPSPTLLQLTNDINVASTTVRALPQSNRHVVDEVAESASQIEVSQKVVTEVVQDPMA